MSSLWASKPALIKIKSGLKASDASKICWKPRRNSAPSTPMSLRLRSRYVERAARLVPGYDGLRRPRLRSSWRGG